MYVFEGERESVYVCVCVCMCMCLPSKFRLHYSPLCFFSSITSTYIHMHKCRSRKDALVEVVDAIR